MSDFNPHTAAEIATALEEATGAHHEPWPDDGDGGCQCGGCQRDMHLSSSELEPRGLCDRCIDQAISDASAAAAQLRAAIGEIAAFKEFVAASAEVAKEYARRHASECKTNPLRVERDKALAERDSALAAVARLTEENERLRAETWAATSWANGHNCGDENRELYERAGRAEAENAQHTQDWTALMVLIAQTVGTAEDREAAEMGEVEEFDPWHALRTYAADRDSLSARLAEVEADAERVTAVFARARVAAKALSALIADLGSFVDDSDPRVMSVAGPIGEAEADLFIALGIYSAGEGAKMYADIDSRCAVCGWTLAESADKGCVRGNCSYRPRPEKLYAPARAALESAALLENKP